MADRPLLLSAPNVSEGADREAVARIGASFSGALLLDVHSDADHGRSVFTVAAYQGELAGAVVAAAAEAQRSIDLTRHVGLHPHVGAIDVAPLVYLDEAHRGAACAEALTLANRLGEELQIPVFLYGDLATGPGRRERAELRRGGPDRLRGRVESGELVPDLGPAAVGRRSGATLVTARPPLVAFNVDLASEDVGLARRIAADLRESAGGRPGVRAIGLGLAERGCAQVSFNLEDPLATPLAEIVEAVAARAPVARAELVGLAPAAALERFPPEVELLASEPRSVEDAVRSVAMSSEPPGRR